MFFNNIFQNFQSIEEESTTKKSGRRGSQVSLPTPVREDTETAGSSDSEETADTRKFVFKLSHTICVHFFTVFIVPYLFK